MNEGRRWSWWVLLLALGSPLAQAGPQGVQYLVGGSIAGLADGQSFTLLLNGSQALPRSANGTFQFPVGLADGSPYAVRIGSQPATQTCSIAGADGLVAGSNVGTVQVQCGNPGIELLFSGPALPVRPGQSGVARVRLSGALVAGAQFRLCFQDSQLAVGIPQVPPALFGMSCQPASTTGACPAPTNRGVFCFGFSDFSDWPLPQTIDVPFTVATGATGNSAAPLLFETLPPPLYSTQLGQELPITLVTGVFAIAPPASALLAAVASTGPLSAGQGGSVSVLLDGTEVSAASFGLCFDPASLALSAAPAPAGLPGFACAAPVSGGCPLPNQQRIACSGTSSAAPSWTLPQTQQFDFTVLEGAPAGPSALPFASVAPAFVAAGQALTPALQPAGSVLIVLEPLYVDGFEDPALR